MCGIAGFLRFDGQPPDKSLLQRMTDVIAHRGPDGDGAWVTGPVALGHRRLAIIDLSPAGKQPMSNEDGTIWITYNGEIYNFKEIRQELLEQGHQFCSATDTEVIVHAYEEWGVACLERFNGMFAFALWDARKQQLWLVRDRFGVKPLFYAHLHHCLLFGSEIKALLPSPELQREIDLEALSYYLALNYTPAPHTLLKDVRQVMPGHYLVVDHSGRIEDVEYWDLMFDETSNRSEQDYLDELTVLIEDSIRIRLVSDVPFGALLSGGIDSSTVSYWMSRNLSSPVKTFSIGFPEGTFNELAYAREVSRAIGSDHHERIVSGDIENILPKIVWHTEEPTADSSQVAMYHVAQLAREKVTMVLSGDGADEIFAGYETYQAYPLHRLYSLFPGYLREKLFVPLANFLPVSSGKVSLSFKLRRFLLSGAYSSSEDAHIFWRMIFDAAARKELLAPVWDKPGTQANVLDLYRAAFQRTNARHPLNRMLYVDSRVYLPNDMLVKVDRMTMAHSLEAREPFLDYRLATLAGSIPPKLKLKGMRHGKYILKAVMSNRIPQIVTKRKKEGFNVPNAHWIRNELKPFVTDHLSHGQLRVMGLLEPKAVDTLLQLHFGGRADYSHQIWCLLSLSLWWQQFMESSQ